MNLTITARKLRKDLTKAEKFLWYLLKSKNLAGYKFRRQAIIGKFIVDFACFDKKLIIEIDGGQHYESELDKKRDLWLESQGFKVIRFWNNEVLKNREGVAEQILEFLKSPSPSPSHQGRGKKSV